MAIEDGYEKEPNYGFTVHSNDAVRDKGMRDLELIGLLTVLRALPPNWILYPKWLREEFKLGRDKVQFLLKELTDRGYLGRKRKRNQNGTLGGYVFKVKNTIISKAEPEPDFQGLGPQPLPEKQERPQPKNQGAIVNTQSLLNTNGALLPSAEKTSKVSEYGESFDKLWESWPKERRGYKKEAAKALANLKPEERENIPRAVEAYLKTRKVDRDGKSYAHALHNWLAKGVYADFLPAAEPKPEIPDPATIPRHRWEIHLDDWRRNDRWPVFLGPEPGFPGSFVPSDLLKFGEQDEADERIMRILEWMPEHERRECEAGLRSLPRWIETRAKIFDAARLGQAPSMDHGCPPCGLLPGLSDGGSGGEAGEIHTGK